MTKETLKKNIKAILSEVGAKLEEGFSYKHPQFFARTENLTPQRVLSLLADNHANYLDITESYIDFRKLSPKLKQVQSWITQIEQTISADLKAEGVKAFSAQAKLEFAKDFGDIQADLAYISAELSVVTSSLSTIMSVFERTNSDIRLTSNVYGLGERDGGSVPENTNVEASPPSTPITRTGGAPLQSASTESLKSSTKKDSSEASKPKSANKPKKDSSEASKSKSDSKPKTDSNETSKTKLDNPEVSITSSPQGLLSDSSIQGVSFSFPSTDTSSNDSKEDTTKDTKKSSVPDEAVTEIGNPAKKDTSTLQDPTVVDRSGMSDGDKVKNLFSPEDSPDLGEVFTEKELTPEVQGGLEIKKDLQNSDTDESPSNSTQEKKGSVFDEREITFPDISLNVSIKE